MTHPDAGRRRRFLDTRREVSRRRHDEPHAAGRAELRGYVTPAHRAFADRLVPGALPRAAAGFSTVPGSDGGGYRPPLVRTAG